MTTDEIQILREEQGIALLLVVDSVEVNVSSYNRLNDPGVVVSNQTNEYDSAVTVAEASDHNASKQIKMPQQEEMPFGGSG